jgi:hypothetical protein
LRYSNRGQVGFTFLTKKFTSSFTPGPTLDKDYRPGINDPGYKHADCPQPMKFSPWKVDRFVPGPDNWPTAFEYGGTPRNVHKLSIIDIDMRDTRMAVYVDNILKLNTSDPRSSVPPNQKGRGVVIVPPRKVVRIEWIGERVGNSWFPLLVFSSDAR